MSLLKEEKLLNRALDLGRILVGSLQEMREGMDLSKISTGYKGRHSLVDWI